MNIYNGTNDIKNLIKIINILFKILKIKVK